MVTRVSGTEGYAEEADTLVAQYESIAFAHAQRSILDLIPAAPARVIDIGAGTGRDAAGFAALGHRVLAVEPTEPFRVRAMALHPSPRIEWLDDGLPELARVRARRESFDVVLMNAVWMHLDDDQRRRGMPNVAALVRPGGIMSLSLRYGPVPAGRRMFAVPAEETIELAAAEGLSLLRRNDHLDSAFNRPGISWTRLVLQRPVP